MGAHKNITSNTFPKQGALLHQRLTCYFHWDTTKPVTGTVVRDDAEEPSRTIIHLDDGRFILATECQYSPCFSQKVISVPT